MPDVRNSSPGSLSRIAAWQTLLDKHHCKPWRMWEQLFPPMCWSCCSPPWIKGRSAPFGLHSGLPEQPEAALSLGFFYKPQTEENHRGKKSLKSALEIWLLHFSSLSYFLTRQIYSRDKHMLRVCWIRIKRVLRFSTQKLLWYLSYAIHLSSTCKWNIPLFSPCFWCWYFCRKDCLSRL